jgi:hypothetical protein
MAKDQKKENKLETALRNCFKANPKTNKLFQTSDGQCFYTEHDANEHASRLEDKEVTENERGNTTKGDQE